MTADKTLTVGPAVEAGTDHVLASEKLYLGTSDSGNISEAIEAAILSAKEGIPSSFVRWELVKIQGESGGFIDKNSVTVSIHAVAQSV